jgi:VWFA-related protein
MSRPASDVNLKIHLFILGAVLGFGFWLLAGLSVAAPQEQSGTPDTTLKVSTNVVNVYAVVRDKHGRLIPDLNQQDFALVEDNVPQQIRYFARETDTPLTIGMLIDTSVSQGSVLPIEQQEAKAFLREVMRPKDLAFVLHFDLEVELLRDLTANQKLLGSAIDEVVINGGGRGPMPGTNPGPGIGGTHLFDAVYLAANDLLKNEIGRKVLILLTDGEDQGSRMTLNAALEAAQKTDLIIYSVDIVDREFYFGRGRGTGLGFSGDAILKKLSEESGGRVIRVSNKPGETAMAFEELARELRTQYSLGYSPTNQKRDGSFRKIRVQLQSGDFKVQSRRGYYAPTT